MLSTRDKQLKNNIDSHGNHERILAPTRKECITTQAIVGVFNTPAALENTMYNYVGGDIDAYITGPRISQVVSAAIQNRVDAVQNNTPNLPADDGYNPDSSWNQLIYQDPIHSDLGLTPIGATFVGLVALPITVGIGRRIYQIYHKKQLNSYKYIKERLHEVRDDLGIKNKTYKKNEIIDGFNQLLVSGQVGKPEQANDSLLSTTEEYYSEEDSEDKIIKNIVDYDEHFEPNLFVKTINKITETSPAQLIGNVWDYLSNQSLLFWVIGFPVGLALGAAAAAATPIVLGVTAIIGGLGLLYAGAYHLYKKVTHKEDVPEAITKEEELQIDKLKQLYFMQEEHKMIMSMLRDEYDVQDIEENGIEKVDDAEGCYEIDRSSRKVIRIQKRPVNPAPAASMGEYARKSPEDIFKTPIAQHLLGSQTERNARLGITTAAAAVSGFIITTFVLYFASCAIALIPTVGAAAAASALLGTELTFFGSLSIGALFGVTTYCKTRAAQLAYEKKVYQTLSAEYKPGKTKADRFSELHEQVERKKREITQLRTEITAFNQATNYKKDNLISKFDLNKIDVFNDYYFEKQKHSPSLFTWIKKGLNRAYTFVGGGESGIYLVRNMFLIGGIAAGVIAAAATGALIPFLIAAGVAGGIWGITKLIQYQLDRNQQHREAFLDGIDNRIKYLELKNQQLDAVFKKLTKNKEEVRGLYSSLIATKGLRERECNSKMRPKFKNFKNDDFSYEETEPLLGNNDQPYSFKNENENRYSLSRYNGKFYNHVSSSSGSDSENLFHSSDSDNENSFEQNKLKFGSE